MAAAFVYDALRGRGKPVSAPQEGSRELPGTSGAVTAREALSLIRPVVLEAARLAQAVYGLQPTDPEATGSPVRLTFRISPRPDAEGKGAGLPLDFVDSPDAVRELTRAGADWIAGDPDMTLSTRRLRTGKMVWVTESYGKEFVTPFLVEGPWRRREAVMRTREPMGPLSIESARDSGVLQLGPPASRAAASAILRGWTARSCQQSSRCGGPGVRRDCGFLCGSGGELLRVELHEDPAASEWSAAGTLFLEAGQLEGLARSATRVFRGEAAV